MKPVKNEKNHDVKVNYQDADGKDQEVTLTPGQEIEVPEASAEGVKQQIETAQAPGSETPEEAADANARKAADEDAGNGSTPPATGSTTPDNPSPDANTATNTPPADANTGTDPNASTNGDLSKKDREELEALRAEKAETMFSKLVDEGKVVPAQKEAVLALAKASGPDAVAQMFSKAPKVVDFSERGSNTEHKDNEQTSGSGAETDLKKNVKQWSDLSQAEQATQKTLGISEEMYNETALANPQHYQKSSKQ